MPKLEDFIAANEVAVGGPFQHGTLEGPAILQMLQEGRIRVGQRDNALLVEIDEETYTLPDGFRLSSFP